MLLITWNVNSLRARMERFKALLERHRPDLVCLQELKLTDDRFPHLELRDLGYTSAVFGQKTYNGVAILARGPLLLVERGFDSNPVPAQARVLSAEVGGVRIVNVYVVNGQSVGSDQYDLKLRFLSALSSWLAGGYDPHVPLLVAGDFNIAPDDRDVYDPSAWKGRILCSEPERAALKDLKLLNRAGESGSDEERLKDLLRCHTQERGVFTWWDYRYKAFHRDWGLRLDLVLGNDPMVQRLVSVEVDRNERKKGFGHENPSDHAPVLAFFR